MRHDTRHFYLWHLGLPLLLAAGVLTLFESTDLDLWIAAIFFDPVQHAFPLREQPFLERVVHRGGKYTILLVALAALAVYVASWWVVAWRDARRAALYVFLAIALGTGAVSGLKKVTNKHCPYDLAVYGGSEPYVRLLQTAPAGTTPGHCFPGGHASGGFALMAFYFVWYRRRPRLAYAALAGGFAYGMVLGIGRMLQGAHFLSHNLWAALVCWLVALALYRLLWRDPRPATNARRPG